VFESIRADTPEIVNVSPAVASYIGRAIGALPHPLVTDDRFLRLQTDVVLDELAPTLRLHDLGIEASSMEHPGFNFLHVREHARRRRLGAGQLSPPPFPSSFPSFPRAPADVPLGLSLC